MFPAHVHKVKALPIDTEELNLFCLKPFYNVGVFSHYSSIFTREHQRLIIQQILWIGRSFNSAGFTCYQVISWESFFLLPDIVYL